MRLDWISWTLAVSLSWGQCRGRRCRSAGSIICWVKSIRVKSMRSSATLLVHGLLLVVMILTMLVLLARRRCRGRSIADTGSGMRRSSIGDTRSPTWKRSRRRAGSTVPTGIAAAVMLVKALHDLGLPLPLLGLLLLLLLPGHDIPTRIAFLSGTVATVVVKAGPRRRPGPIQNLPRGPPGLPTASGSGSFAGR